MTFRSEPVITTFLSSTDSRLLTTVSVRQSLFQPLQLINFASFEGLNRLAHAIDTINCWFEWSVSIILTNTWRSYKRFNLSQSMELDILVTFISKMLLFFDQVICDQTYLWSLSVGDVYTRCVNKHFQLFSVSVKHFQFQLNYLPSASSLTKHVTLSKLIIFLSTK